MEQKTQPTHYTVMQKQRKCVNGSKAVLWQHLEQAKVNPRVQIQHQLLG